MGAPKMREVGGGPAVGLADNLINFLQQGLTFGTFGGGNAGGQAAMANPMGSTIGISGVLNDILSGGAGNIGGSMAQLISKQGERDANALRERFTVGGGTSFGTPAAYAESLLRSETAPKLASTIGQLQLSAVLPLLQMMGSLAGKGISQRETIAQPSTFSQIASIASPIIGAVAGGPLGGMIGNRIFGNGMPSLPAAPPMFPGLDLPSTMPSMTQSMIPPSLIEMMNLAPLTMGRGY